MDKPAALRFKRASDLLAEQAERKLRLGQEAAEREAVEEAYRRGYRDAWQQAIDSLFDLYEKEAKRRPPESFRRAYTRAWDFWLQGPLADWQMERPPDDAPLAFRAPPRLGQ